jgi:hypothetical protein
MERRSWSPWFEARRVRRIALEKAPKPMFMGAPIEGENAEQYRAWLQEQTSAARLPVRLKGYC